MTAKRRHFARIYAPRRQRTDNRYGLHILDGDRQEYALERQQAHREAAADDPWLSPEKSAIVRECLILIEYAASHSPLLAFEVPEIDLQGFCLDAALTGRQTEVVLMFGEGFNLNEIADRLDVTRQTVSQHLAYGRRKLVRLGVPPSIMSSRRLDLLPPG